MLEWPDGFGLSVQFFGALALMLLGPRVSVKWQGWFSTLVTISAALHYSFLGPRSVSTTSLLVYDQISLSFVQGYLILLSFQSVLIRAESRVTKPEGPALGLCMSFLGAILLLSNNVVVLVLTTPIYLMLALLGPASSPKGQPHKSGLQAVGGASLVLCLLGLGVGLFVAGGLPLQMTDAKSEALALTKQAMLGWSLISSVLLVLVFVFPISFLAQDFREARDWQLVTIYRIAPSLVFSALLIRWGLLLEDFPAMEYLRAFAALFSVYLFMILVLGRKLLLVVHGLSLLPSTFWFWVGLWS